MVRPEAADADVGGAGARTGERVMRWAVVVVALVLVAAGSVYGYLWYRLGQINSVKCSACAVGGARRPLQRAHRGIGLTRRRHRRRGQGLRQCVAGGRPAQ